MKLLILCLMVPLFVSCAHKPKNSPMRERQAQMEEQLMNKVVAIECTEQSNKICGLIAEELRNEGPRIEKELCEPQKISEKECRLIWAKMALQKLSERYTHANFDKVLNECSADPIYCNFHTLKGFEAYERNLRHSHNMGILDAIDRLRANVAEVEEQEAKERRQRSAAAWQAFGESMANQPKPQPYMMPVNKTTTCTSNRVGNQVFTTCN